MFLIEAQREAILKTILADHPRAFCTGFVFPYQWNRIKADGEYGWRLAVLTTNQDGRPDQVFVLAERWAVTEWICGGFIGRHQLQAATVMTAALQVTTWLQYRHIEEVAVFPTWGLSLALPSTITSLVEAEARVERAREATRQRYQPKRVAYGRS